MRELIVEPGRWAGVVAAEAEAFLYSVSIILGLTQKRQDFLDQVYKDIHGSFKPDQFYIKDLLNCKGILPSMLLDMFILKTFNPDQKKQLKIWYTELLTMEPMDDVLPFLQQMITDLSKTINQF